MARSTPASGTPRAALSAKATLAVLCLTLAGLSQADAATVTAKCTLTAQIVGHGGASARIGYFEATSRVTASTDNVNRALAKDALSKALPKCYSAALRSGGIPSACVREYSCGNTATCRVRGWKWTGGSLREAALNAACRSGLNPTKEVDVWLSCSQGLAGPTRLMRAGRCPGRPAPAARPNLPPPPSSGQQQQQQQQQQLSLVCLNGAVVNGQCRCLPGSRPQLIGPKAYRCVRGPR